MTDSNWLLLSPLGGPIFAGLRRAFGEPRRAKPAADQGAGPAGADRADRQLAPTLSLAGPSAKPLAEQADAPEQVGRLGDVATGLATQGHAWADWTVRQAANRAISPNSVTGISLLLGLCAAVWFSGGSRHDDVWGLITTGAWVVVRAGARQLAAVTTQRASRPPGPAAPGGGRRRPEPDQIDWLVLPGFDWGADAPPGRLSTGRLSTGRLSTGRLSAGRPCVGRARERDLRWFYAVCATAGECAIYGGIAAGAESAGWTATWPLAAAVVIVGSAAAIARACGTAAAVTGRSGRQATGPRATLAALTFPPIGVRVLVAALVMVGYGPRIALVAVLTVAVTALARNLVRTGGRMAAVRQEAAASPAGRAAATAAQDMLLACRDDGPVARRAGWLVRGNLMPVPPAVAGIVAIGLLALLGMKNLPGIVALTPVVVMLLAAPGSSHPHDGRIDWLVPVLLCLAQYGYLTALGPAKSVAWPLVFAACSMTAVWYASLAASRPGAAPPRARSSRKVRVSQIMAMRTEGIGWEGRVGIVGLAGMFGIATFGYLGLTVCLSALICGKVIRDYLRQGEDQRQ